MFHRSSNVPHKSTLIFCTFLMNFPLFPWTSTTIFLFPTPSWWTLDTLKHPPCHQLPLPPIFLHWKPLKQLSASSCRPPVDPMQPPVDFPIGFFLKSNCKKSLLKVTWDLLGPIYTFLHLCKLQSHPPSPPNRCHIKKQLNYMHDNFTEKYIKIHKDVSFLISF